MTLEQRYREATSRMLTDGFDDLFTPADATAHLSKNSASIGADAEIFQVPVHPFDGMKLLRCFDNCEAVKRKLKGKVVHGWAWHQWKKLLVVAEFHAVWLAPDDQLIDITPPITPRSFTTFTIDPIRVAHDVTESGPLAAHKASLTNRWFALKELPVVHEWIGAEAAITVLNKRRFAGEQISIMEVVLTYERNVLARSALLNYR